MVEHKKELFIKRRNFVNEEFGRVTEGKTLTRAKQKRILKGLWSKSKRTIK